jgi:hypothetical protein
MPEGQRIADEFSDLSYRSNLPLEYVIGQEDRKDEQK